MRPPPPLSELPHYPVTGGLALLALGVSAASLLGHVDVSVLYEDCHILQFQYWRLLTSVLPHANIFHLAFNLYWVWVFGSLIEESFGHLKSVLLVVVLALGSGAAEYAVLEGGIGLSGVGYGMFGFLWALSRWSPRFRGVVDKNTTVLFIAWFFLCIGLTYTKIMPVANIAHGIGAILGGLIGMAALRWDAWRRWAAGGAAAAIVIASLLGATVGRYYVNLSPERGQHEGYEGYQALVAHDPAAAQFWLRHAVRMAPKTAGYWHNLAIACDELGDNAHAEEYFAKAGVLDPKLESDLTQAQPQSQPSR